MISSTTRPTSASVITSVTEDEETNPAKIGAWSWQDFLAPALQQPFLPDLGGSYLAEELVTTIPEKFPTTSTTTTAVKTTTTTTTSTTTTSASASTTSTTSTYSTTTTEKTPIPIESQSQSSAEEVPSSISSWSWQEQPSPFLFNKEVKKKRIIINSLPSSSTRR